MLFMNYQKMIKQKQIFNRINYIIKQKDPESRAFLPHLKKRKIEFKN